MPKAVDFRRRGITAAALGAAGVLAVSLVQDIATTIISLVGSASLSLAGEETFGNVVSGSLYQSLTTTLPFTVGVFVSLWQFAPIGAVLRLGHVVTRSLLAAASGSVAILIVGVVINLAQGIATFVDGRFAVFGRAASDVLLSLGFAVQTAAMAFVTALPLVVLASVLLWMWTRSTDRDHRVEGMLDL